MTVTEENASSRDEPASLTRIGEVWLEERRGGSTIGIGEPAPHLSWAAAGTFAQAEYELELTGHDGQMTLVRRASNDSHLIKWPAEPLRSREHRVLRVRLWDTNGGATEWSEPLAVEAGLLNEEDWQADFISPSVSAPVTSARPGYLLRAEFSAPADIVRTRVYSTAHGIYTIEVNGVAVSEDRLAPGWTSYKHRLRYQTYDVGGSISEGLNAIGVSLADGWYRGRLGFNGGRWDNYGSDVAVLLQIDFTLSDGTHQIVPLADEWRWAPSPVRAVGLYEGETYDASFELEGWSLPGFDDSAWAAPHILPRTDFEGTLEAPTGPPVRTIEALSPVSAERPANGRIRLDFGQNISGLLEITVDAPLGHTIRLHHAEVLEDGELATRPLRNAPSIDTYVGSGSGLKTWSPQFTIHGFRYAELENWPGEFDPSAVRALVIHTQLRRSGWFESSNSMLNKFHENVIWSMRDNFVDLPTDCPQRDERLGWTGDIQVFTPTASFLFDVHGTLDGWLRDVAAEQNLYGSVPNFVPWIECGFPADPAAAWGDAAVIVPWVLYERYGDIGILQRQYPSMQRWVDLEAERSGPDELWNTGFQLGDWLDPSAPPDNPADSTTDKYLVASAYRAYSTRLLARVAAMLGREADSKRYGDMADRVSAAFQREFVTPNGRLASDTPTAYSLAIVFDLLGTGQREVAGRRLNELVAAAGFRISTGFVGTPIVCDALAATGSMDAAYHLLLQKDYPSWLYPVTMGATTVWERWDSMLPDGTINPGEMTSFNHYAFGAVADFMHRVVAGLAPAEPGYRALVIEPRPGGKLTFAAASHETPYGTASSSWIRDGETFTLTVAVPEGCSAEVRMPDGSAPVTVQGGLHEFSARFRAAAGDPEAPVLFNIHNPEHRAARERERASNGERIG